MKLRRRSSAGTLAPGAARAAAAGSAAPRNAREELLAGIWREALGREVVGLVLENTTHTDPTRTTILGKALHALKPILDIDGALWFVDIKKQQIHRFNPATGEAIADPFLPTGALVAARIVVGRLAVVGLLPVDGLPAGLQQTAAGRG